MEEQPKLSNRFPMQIGKDAMSAKRLVEELTFRVTQLEEQIGALQTEKELLREQLKRHRQTHPNHHHKTLRKDQAESPEQKRQETRGTSRT